jgi:hypothetical protein
MTLGVESTSNRNEYHEYFVWGEGGRYVRLTTLPPSCADCLEIWKPQALSRSSGIALLFYFTYCIGYVEGFQFLSTPSFELSVALIFGQLYRGVDKSLARPGRKQATATKLCKPLKKKKSEGCPSNQVSAAAMTSA